MRYRTGTMLILVTFLAGCAGCAGGTGVGPGTPGVPDGVLLQPADLEGLTTDRAPVTEIGPAEVGHPLPPRPCHPPAADGPAPLGERRVTATFGRFLMYGYAARYPDGAAARVFDDLMDGFAGCPGDREPGERFQVLARYAAGALVQREFADGTAAYFLGYAGPYLVAVVEVGAARPEGDLTIAGALGHLALRRAGGAAGEVVPTGGTTVTAQPALR